MTNGAFGDAALRLFVAVELSEELRTGIGRLISDLAVRWPEARWVSPDNLHLTVKFLGSTPIGLVSPVGAALDRAAGGVTRFDLSLVGLGTFGPAAQPRVVWVGVGNGGAQMAGLAAAVDHELGQLGIEREQRPYRAHLTMARGRGDAIPSDVRAEFSAARSHDWGRQSVGEIVLMASELRREGPHYSVVSRHPLGGE